MNKKSPIYPPIYLFSPAITYKRFKRIWNEFDGGDIKPIDMEKAIWGMIKEKRLFVYLDAMESIINDNPVCFALKLPKNREVYLIK